MDYQSALVSHHTMLLHGIPYTHLHSHSSFLEGTNEGGNVAQ